MKPKATTFRIDPQVQGALEILSKTLKRPMNQLVNEAVRAYVDKRSTELEHDLEETLTLLRAYRKRDPEFTRAIDRVASAEARYGKEDKTEGVVVIGTLVDGKFSEDAGPVQSEIDQLLHG